MESLMRRRTRRCCSCGDQASNQRLHEIITVKSQLWESNGFPTWVSLKGMHGVVLPHVEGTIERERERERESCIWEMRSLLCCEHESAIFSATGFLFIHYIRQLEPRCLSHTMHLPVSIHSTYSAAVKGCFCPRGWVLPAHSWPRIISSMSDRFSCFVAFKSTQSRRSESKIIVLSAKGK